MLLDLLVVHFDTYAIITILQKYPSNNNFAAGNLTRWIDTNRCEVKTWHSIYHATVCAGTKITTLPLIALDSTRTWLDNSFQQLDFDG